MSKERLVARRKKNTTKNDSLPFAGCLSLPSVPATNAAECYEVDFWFHLRLHHQKLSHPLFLLLAYYS